MPDQPPDPAGTTDKPYAPVARPFEMLLLQVEGGFSDSRRMVATITLTETRVDSYQIIDDILMMFIYPRFQDAESYASIRNTVAAIMFQFYNDSAMVITDPSDPSWSYPNP